MKRTRKILSFLPLFLLCAGFTLSSAVANEKKAEPDWTTLSGVLIKQLSPSLADLEFFFLPDEKGERPEFRVGYFCPNCKRMHTKSAKSLINEQKPFKVPAYAIAPDEFIAADIGVLQEWLENVDLVFAGKRYPAKIVAYYPERYAMRLKTATPVSGIVPLKFNPKAEGSRFGFFRGDEGGVSRATIGAWSVQSIFHDFGTGKDYVRTPANLLVVNAKGEVVGLSMRQNVAIGEEPAEQPGDWKEVPVKEFEKSVADFKAMLHENLLPVQIRLKSVKRPTGFAARYSRDDDDDKRTEVDGIGLKMRNGRILVSAMLTPAMTARLSSIAVITGEGKEVPAKFVGSLRFFGGLIAEPEQALAGKGIPLYAGDLAKLYLSPIYEATVKTFGKRLEINVMFKELDSFETGFRGMLSPGNSDFVFTRTGELLAVPLQMRKGISSDYSTTESVSSDMVRKLAENFDPANTPQQGAEQIAWLGVEFQKLDSELARANNAAGFTADGEHGILVTYIYPDSPASSLGLKLGDILLSVRAEDVNMPTKFKGYEFDNFMEQFPWEQYDQIPQQYFDQIPQPWGTVRNKLNKLLGDIGIGGKARLSVLSNGELRELAFTVSASPANFETAERFNDAKLGLTTSDLTYEVRNYFQLKPEDTGVLVAAVKAGGRAAVAGIRPYEILTTVNDVPIKDLETFRKQLEQPTELRIGVRRFAVTRIVTISAPEPENP